MRTFIISLLLGCVVLSAYSQSKLQGAGKASKVGTATGKKSSTTQPPVSKQNSVKGSAPIKKPTTNNDPDAKYASSGFMDISGVSFANIDYESNIIDDYGSNLYATEVKFLSSKVFYKGLASEKKDITLYYKIIDEEGNLKSGTSSPEGYTTSGKVSVLPGNGQSFLFSGWGSKNGGTYNAGVYRFEIWYQGNILYQKNIRLYSGTTPIANNRIIKIDSLSFGNVDKDGNFITPIGGVLYEQELKYLKPKLYYHGLSASNQNLVFYYRIFTSSGTMICGDSSPQGYSLKESVTIKPGYNSLLLSGWGKSGGGAYEVGNNKYEIWLDGEKLYETKFFVKKKEGVASFLTVDSKTSVSTSFGVNGGTETFYVKTDAGTWETWGVPSWCEIKSKTATSFTLTCKPNTTGSERSDYMKVKAGGKEVKISIKQSTTDSVPSFGLG